MPLQSTLLTNGGIINLYMFKSSVSPSLLGDPTLSLHFQDFIDPLNFPPIQRTAPSLRREMGREKIKIKKIDDISARQVTFSKRRQGLMKKAGELAILCEAEVTVIIFSPAGRLYQYSSTDIKDTINKFFLHLDSRQHSVGFQGGNKNNTNLHRGVEDKINYLRHIRSEYLQHFRAEELLQLEIELDGMLKYVKEKKKELCMDEVPALHKKDIRTTDPIRTQCGEFSYSAQEAIGTIPKMNPQGDCSEYSQNRRIAHSGATNYPDRWIPPPTDVYKVNFAGVNFQTVSGVGVGVGVVVRNWRGDFMAALTRFFPEIMDMNTTFWMGAKCAIEFSVDYYFTHIVLEGDAPNPMKGLQNTHEDHSQTSTNIMQEAKGHMRQLSSCSISHVQTSGNIVAHVVAQYARNVKNEHVWLMKEPDFLGDILLADIGQLNY